MPVEPGRTALDARVAASSVEDRVAWLMTMRWAAIRSVWQQADDAGVVDPVEQAEFLLRRLYPEESEAWFASVLDQLRTAHAAGTWSGFRRPENAYRRGARRPRNADSDKLRVMANIDVSCVTAADGWLCQVTVADGGSESRHSVTFTRADFQRLASSGESPGSLVRRSFEFLLAREPKESILKSFALTDIGGYFSEYEREIGRSAG